MARVAVAWGHPAPQGGELRLRIERPVGVCRGGPGMFLREERIHHVAFQGSALPPSSSSSETAMGTGSSSTFPSREGRRRDMRRRCPTRVRRRPLARGVVLSREAALPKSATESGDVVHANGCPRLRDGKEARVRKRPASRPAPHRGAPPRGRGSMTARVAGTYAAVAAAPYRGASIGRSARTSRASQAGSVRGDPLRVRAPRGG